APAFSDASLLSHSPTRANAPPTAAPRNDVAPAAWNFVNFLVSCWCPQAVGVHSRHAMFRPTLDRGIPGRCFGCLGGWIVRNVLPQVGPFLLISLFLLPQMRHHRPNLDLP